MFRSSLAAFYPLPRCLFYRVGRFHWGGFIIVFLRLPVRSEVKKVIHWMSEILFAAEIAFRLWKDAPEELNLLQLVRGQRFGPCHHDPGFLNYRSRVFRNRRDGGN
jgi:hypothetical protein